MFFNKIRRILICIVLVTPMISFAQEDEYTFIDHSGETTKPEVCLVAGDGPKKFLSDSEKLGKLSCAQVYINVRKKDQAKKATRLMYRGFDMHYYLVLHLETDNQRGILADIAHGVDDHLVRAAVDEIRDAYADIRQANPAHEPRITFTILHELNCQYYVWCTNYGGNQQSDKSIDVIKIAEVAYCRLAEIVRTDTRKDRPLHEKMPVQVALSLTRINPKKQSKEDLKPFLVGNSCYDYIAVSGYNDYGLRGSTQWQSPYDAFYLTYNDLRRFTSKFIYIGETSVNGDGPLVSRAQWIEELFKEVSSGGRLSGFVGFTFMSKDTDHGDQTAQWNIMDDSDAVKAFSSGLAKLRAH